MGFQAWLDDYDGMDEERECAETSQEMVNIFEENNRKPVLPFSEIARIEREFRKIDKAQRGLISPQQLAFEWGLDTSTLQETYGNCDISEDGFIDLREFMIMLCPEQNRLPQMDGIEREVFGELLAAE